MAAVTKNVTKIREVSGVQRVCVVLDFFGQFYELLYIILILPVSLFNFVYFCFIYLKALLLITCML